tara:strand:+ start:407 stop:1186 length:780 start_codon:yes stop_codon:yes gene_type:complete
VSTEKKLAWIIGTGPSLNDIDVKKLKDHKTITFNRAYIAFEDWGFDPTYYLSIDSNDLRSMYKDLNKVINNSNVEAFFLTDCWDNINHGPESFQDQEKVDAEEMFVDKENVYTIFNRRRAALGNIEIDHDKNRVHARHYNNSGFMGLIILHALGYNEIAFVGCDARYKDDEESNKDIIEHGGEYESTADTDVNHFRSDYFGKGMRFGKPNESSIISIWRSAKSKIDGIDGLEVYSCTPNSNLNDFYKYIDFEDFLNGKR